MGGGGGGGGGGRCFCSKARLPFPAGAVHCARSARMAWRGAGRCRRPGAAGSGGGSASAGRRCVCFPRRGGRGWPGDPGGRGAGASRAPRLRPSRRGFRGLQGCSCSTEEQESQDVKCCRANEEMTSARNMARAACPWPCTSWRVTFLDIVALAGISPESIARMRPAFEVPQASPTKPRWPAASAIFCRSSRAPCGGARRQEVEEGPGPAPPAPPRGRPRAPEAGQVGRGARGSGRGPAGEPPGGTSPRPKKSAKFAAAQNSLAGPCGPSRAWALRFLLPRRAPRLLPQASP